MRAGLAIGGVALIGVGLAIGFGGFWPETAHADSMVSAEVDVVTIANGSGDVTVRTRDVRAVSVHEDLHYNNFGGTPADRKYTVKGHTLVLSDCGNWCTVDYTVVVPERVRVTGTSDSGSVRIDGARAVDVRADSGDVSVRHVTGDAKVAASSGEVQLRDVGGDATVRADSGDVRLAAISGRSAVTASSGDVRGTGLGGAVEARIDSGDVDLTLAKRGDVTVRADSGSVRVTVPRGRYHVAASADSGDTSIRVPRDAASRYLLRLTADSGDVTVRS